MSGYLYFKTLHRNVLQITTTKTKPRLRTLTSISPSPKPRNPLISLNPCMIDERFKHTIENYWLNIGVTFSAILNPLQFLQSHNAANCSKCFRVGAALFGNLINQPVDFAGPDRYQISSSCGFPSDSSRQRTKKIWVTRIRHFETRERTTHSIHNSRKPKPKPKTELPETLGASEDVIPTETSTPRFESRKTW